MRTKQIAALAGVGIAALAVLIGTPVGAEEDPLTDEPMTISPTSGPPGTAIMVSGASCINTGYTHEVRVTLRNDAGLAVDSAQALPAPEGSWSTRLEVPADVDPSVDLEVSAYCGKRYVTGVMAVYRPAMFDVTATPATTAPPTPTTTPGTPTPPPAVPLEDDPPFTG